MKPEQTTISDLIRQVRGDSNDTVYIGMDRAAARFAVKDDGALIYAFPGAYGQNRTVIQTRYEDVNNVRVPRELIYFCFSKADSREAAALHLYQVAAQVHSVCCLSANAGSTVIQETCFTEAPATGWKRFMRQFPFSEVPAFPLGGRFVAKEETIKLAGLIWKHPQLDRILLATSQYEEALRLWRTGSAPLLCLHLWLAVESIGEIVLQKMLVDKGCTMDELADFYNIPHTQQSKCRKCGHEHEQVVVCPACNVSQPPTKNDRKYHVRARIKREVIFKGDEATYDTIRNTSDSIEHGSGKFADIWKVDFSLYEKTARYFREAIFDNVGLETSERAVLDAAPFDSVYLAPNPPEKQDFGRPPNPYGIIVPPHDWYSLFSPSVKSVEMSEDERSFVVRYESE